MISANTHLKHQCTPHSCIFVYSYCYLSCMIIVFLHDGVYATELLEGLQATPNNQSQQNWTRRHTATKNCPPSWQITNNNWQIANNNKQNLKLYKKHFPWTLKPNSSATQWKCFTQLMFTSSLVAWTALNLTANCYNCGKLSLGRQVLFPDDIHLSGPCCGLPWWAPLSEVSEYTN